MAKGNAHFGKVEFAPPEGEPKAEVIPAVDRVKHDILNARSTAINALRAYSYRRRYYPNQTAEKELSLFQASVVNLYMELREKFNSTEKIRQLDKQIIENEKLKFAVLFDYYCILSKKMEDIKLTRIEFKPISPERSIF